MSMIDFMLSWFEQKNLQTKEYNILWYFCYKLTRLDMDRGLSQAYCIKPEGRIH